MKVLQKTLIDFKLQPETWLFYAFVITSTLSIRKVIYDVPIGGQFNEYTGVFICLADIVFTLFLFFWVIDLLNNKAIEITKSKLSLVSRETITKYWFIALPLTLVLFSFISAIWADNKIIAIFRSLKILEFFVVYIFVIWRLNLKRHRGTSGRNDKFNVSREIGMQSKNSDTAPFISQNNFLNNLFTLIVVIGLLNSIVAIAQFLIQGSTGLAILRESIISPDMPGVAKIVINGHKFIRAYGLFPHPNILGGFLLFSVMLNLVLIKGKKRLAFVSRETKDMYCQNNVSCGTILYFVLTIQLIAFVLTFSKSAFMGLFVAFLYLTIKNGNNLSSALNKAKMPILTVGMVIIVLVLLLNFNFKDFLSQSTLDRLNQYEIYGTVLGFTERPFHMEQIWHYIYGLGMGQYVNEISRKICCGFEFWQYQPVHNVFLLFFAELGIIGFALYVSFLLKLFISNSKALSFEKYDIVSHGTLKEREIFEDQTRVLFDVNTAFKAILLGFAFIMLFDHYFWDIQQGQVIFWLIIGVLAGFRLRAYYTKNNGRT